MCYFVIRRSPESIPLLTPLTVVTKLNKKIALPITKSKITINNNLFLSLSFFLLLHSSIYSLFAQYFLPPASSTSALYSHSCWHLCPISRTPHIALSFSSDHLATSLAKPYHHPSPPLLPPLLKIKKFFENTLMPTRASPVIVGYDLYRFFILFFETMHNLSSCFLLKFLFLILQKFHY